MYRLLSPSEQLSVEGKFHIPITAGSDVTNRILATINNQASVRGNAFRSLRPDCPVHFDLIGPVLELVRQRDIRIWNSHAEINSLRPTYKYYKPSAFCGIDDFKLLMSDPTSGELERLFRPDDYKTTRRMYFVLNNEADELAAWNLIVIDFEAHCFYLFDSRKKFNDASIEITVKTNDQQAQTYTKASIAASINIFLENIMDERYGQPWEFKDSIACLLINYEPVVDNNNDGIAIFTILYFLVSHVSIIYPANDLAIFRMKWAFWLLAERLPR